MKTGSMMEYYGNHIHSKKEGCLMKRLCFLVIIFLIMFNSITVYGADNTIITDINNWNHPVKSTLMAYNIIVTKVELINNKTYPIIYCNFPASSWLQQKEIFEKMLKDTLKSNSYWSYKLVSNLFEVEVTGNPKNKQFIEISYKNIDNYLKKYPKADNIKINYDQAEKIMIRQFGPVVQKTGLIEEDHHEVTIVNSLDSIVEYNNKYYYTVQTLESHYDHIATLGWALIDAYDGSIYYDHQDSIATPADKSKKPIKLISPNDGITYKLLSSSISEPSLWQYNKKNKELQKIDLSTLNIYRGIKLSDTFIKGDLISFIDVSESTLVVVTKEKDSYNIYKSITENDKFRWYLDINSLKSVFKELREILYFNDDSNMYVLSINGGKIKIEFLNNSKDGWIDLSTKK